MTEKFQLQCKKRESQKWFGGKNRLRKEKKNDKKRFPSLIQRRLFFPENYFMAY
jgi:hypothetical protein